MHFRQYDLACLSLYSYMIGDTTTGRAVVVDPQRDISEYVSDANIHGLTIERVIETHFHADFLSGHLELAHATGAVISYGSVARPTSISNRSPTDRSCRSARSPSRSATHPATHPSRSRSSYDASRTPSPSEASAPRRKLITPPATRQ